MNALNFKWSGFKRRSNQLKPWHPHSLRVFHIALAGLVIGLLTYLSPYQRPYNVAQLRIDSVAQERIEAPFLFRVPKSEAELERERQAETAEIPTILHRDPLVQEQQLAQLDSVFAVMIPQYSGPDGRLAQATRPPTCPPTSHWLALTRCPFDPHRHSLHSQ